MRRLENLPAAFLSFSVASRLTHEREKPSFPIDSEAEMTSQDLSAGSFLKFRFTLFVVVVLCATVAVQSQNFKPMTRPGGLDLVELTKAKSSCCGTKAATANFVSANSPEYETYGLTATYYSLRDNLNAILMFNNKGPQPIFATPTFYSLAGTRLQLAPITVPATSYLEVDMLQLLSGADDEFREGSMKISYNGICQ